MANKKLLSFAAGMAFMVLPCSIFLWLLNIPNLTAYNESHELGTVKK